MRKFAVGLAALALLLPSWAGAWWNGDWGYRQKLTINLAAAGVSNVSVDNLPPILVRLHAGNFSFEDTQESGGDLMLVAADDKTPLPFSIERYDWTNGIAYVWVRLQGVEPGAKSTVAWLYYGNANAKGSASTKPVWDASQTLIYHFGAKDIVPRDASGFGNHASQSTAASVADGQIDAAEYYDGETYTTLPASPSLKLTPNGAFSFSAWIKPESVQSGTLYQVKEGSRSFTIALDDGRPVARIVKDDNHQVSTQPSARIEAGSWHLLAVTVSDKLTILLDGAEISSVAASLPDIAGSALLGGSTEPGRGFKGLLDEVRLSNRAVPAESFKFEAAADAPESTLITFDADTQAHGGSDYLETIGVLAGAVTVDGWVVIALITLLGFISGEVAISKAMLLRRTSRANDLFLEKFRTRTEDPLALTPGSPEAQPQESAWKDSSLYAIYSVGASEATRLRRASPGGTHLTGASLEVVRSSLATSLINESNRLTDRMVMLTLSVSGAPFLGLLGTVVGIMITFATIALKGDVNINTIAPGIAAAITATAAGMLVAIPALFGYNVLMTRIKRLQTVMETFSNEFISKVAAAYC